MLSVVLIFFCLSALVQLLNVTAFTLDWYRPLILAFGMMFAFSAFVSTIALVRHFTASAVGTLATPLFFAFALLVNGHIQVVLVGAWLLTNIVAGALACRRRANSRTSPPSRQIILGHAVLSIGFFPAILVQGKILSPGNLLQGKLISAIALIVGLAVGLYFVLLFVIRMPSSVEVAAPEEGLPSRARPTASSCAERSAPRRDASGPDRRADSPVDGATHFGEKDAE
jgi:hypothetical protein